MQHDNELGYIEYTGKQVEKGIIDARAAASALAGFDTAFRYLVGEQRGDLKTNVIPIPVQTRNGSWGFVIPDTFEEWLKLASGVGATTFLAAYAKKAAEQLAENDFKAIGLKDVFSKSFKALVWIVRIGKHLGTLTRKRIRGIRWRNGDTEVGIPNDAGEYLFIPIEFYQMFVESPNSILRRLTEVVDEERTLVIGYEENGTYHEEQILPRDKQIFGAADDDMAQITLPHLVHGQRVVLEGVVTRANKTSNTIGFRYEDHILTCSPAEGTVEKDKPCIFLPCKITGTINRADEKGVAREENPPHIIYEGLVIIDSDAQQGKLF